MVDARTTVAAMSNVCWNIQHHTGMGHSPEFAALTKRTKGKSVSSTVAPITMLVSPVVASSSSKLKRIGSTEFRPLHSLISDLRAYTRPSIYSLVGGGVSPFSLDPSFPSMMEIVV
ncbi:hypothetical protein Tco_0952959 [Tanacetum coccineum]|uniref:Uncharacterized protein n=1 Tax=Tanacetum coccineum TaxID=301880 RepID=A0ABQ5E3X2_9ASTR